MVAKFKLKFMGDPGEGDADEIDFYEKKKKALEKKGFEEIEFIDVNDSACTSRVAAALVKAFNAGKHEIIMYEMTDDTAILAK